MKITKRQKQEIDFFAKWGNFEPSEQEIKEYIDETVYGIKKNQIKGFGKSNNRISQSKRNLEITIPMWKEDLVNGLLSIEELIENFGDSQFGFKIIKQIATGLDFKKRQKEEGFEAISLSNAIYILKHF